MSEATSTPRGLKFPWRPKHGGPPPAQQGGISKDGSARKTRKTPGKIQEILGKRNPRGDKVRTRHRGNKIDEAGELERRDSSSLEAASRSLESSLQDEFESFVIDETVNDSSTANDDLPLDRPTLSRTSSSSPTVDTHKPPRRGVSFDPDALKNIKPLTPLSQATEGVSLQTFKSDRNKFRVKPFQCFPEGVYMTEAEIYQHMMKPSENAEFLASYVAPSTKTTKELEVSGVVQRLWGTPRDGRIGSVRVEVLGCIGLAPAKPDVSVYLICGDAAFATDTISSCRSPMWPFNSKRAAVFPIHFAYVRLFAGVFASKKENDQFCGRVVLDIASLRPNTEYDVTLPLRVSSFIYDRRPRGVIRLRFSVHWFSERAAIMSYLKSPHSLSKESASGIPTISCGDPKTFRNVALTLHGKHLPGKYTRSAFRATMREFNLSQQNLRYFVTVLIQDIMLYEKPLLSIYVFIAWMHCVYSGSVGLAPACFVGFLICNLVHTYFVFSTNEKNHLGYPSLTVQELISAMIAKNETGSMESLHTVKRAKNVLNDKWNRPAGPSFGNLDDAETYDDIELMDHREFPFSEKAEYPKFTVEDGLAYNKNLPSRGNQKRQLSVYVKDAGRLMDETEADTKSDDEGDLDDSENDDEMTVSIHGDVDTVLLMEEVDEEEEDVRRPDLSFTTDASQLLRRIPIGPPQDTDQKPRKKIPPQVILARAENALHKATGHISMDKIYHSSLSIREVSEDSFGSEMSALDVSQEFTSRPTPRRRRSQLDEFDKRLGLRSRHPNPVGEITSSFLGPLMRIFRVFLMVVRVAFNVGTWRDPILTFWIFCFLVVLMLILLAFPWRSFLFLVGLACFGPQNILVRHWLAKKVSNEAAQQEGFTNWLSVDRQDSGNLSLTDGTNPGSTSGSAKKGPRRRLQTKIAQMKARRRLKKEESTLSDTEQCPVRPPFTAAKYVKPPKTTLVPRDVVVPYTKGRTERFYDWPPDPTVARATPVALDEDNGYSAEKSSSPTKLFKSTSTPTLRRRR